MYSVIRGHTCPNYALRAWDANGLDLLPPAVL